MLSVVSLEAAIARIQAIQTAFTPPAPQPAATAAPADSSFASQLQGAMGGGTATATATAPAASAQAAPGTYPHLDGDLDANPELLRRLDALAAKKGVKFHLTSGLRTLAE